MGGVDLFDKRGLYRIRSKKSYWTLFRFCLDGSIFNLRNLRRYVDKNILLLDFTRQIIIALLVASDLESKIDVRPNTKKQHQKVTRFDSKDNLVNKNDAQRWCVARGKFVSIKCSVKLYPDTYFVQVSSPVTLVLLFIIFIHLYQTNLFIIFCNISKLFKLNFCHY